MGRSTHIGCPALQITSFSEFLLNLFFLAHYRTSEGWIPTGTLQERLDLPMIFTQAFNAIRSEMSKIQGELKPDGRDNPGT